MELKKESSLFEIGINHNGSMQYAKELLIYQKIVAVMLSSSRKGL